MSTSRAASPRRGPTSWLVGVALAASCSRGGSAESAPAESAAEARSDVTPEESPACLIAPSLACCGTTPRTPTPGHHLPYRDECLRDPVVLPSCPTVRVVEWRASPGSREGARRTRRSSAASAAIAALDATCKRVFARFSAFVTEHELGEVAAAAFDETIAVSVVPAGWDDGGHDFRGLNDHLGRFADRKHELGSDGRPYDVHGYCFYRSMHVFIRNDVLTREGQANAATQRVFAHELFHALSHTSGVLGRIRDRGEEDEDYAVRFTAWLERSP